MGTKRGAGAAVTRQPGQRHWFRRVVLLLLVLVLAVGLGPLAVVRIASAARLYSVDDVPVHDVAIVYGAGLAASGPGPYLVGRLEVARQLFEAGKVRAILVSGDNLSEYHDEPDAMAAWLVDHGVPGDKIVADYAGEDTYSTCYRARQIFGVTSAILVSQTYHLPRAVATCRFVGVDAVGVGDLSVKAGNPRLWASYQLREVAADANMVWEVVTHRQPILGPYEPGIDHALGR